MMFSKNLYLQKGGYHNDDPITIMIALKYLLDSIELEKNLSKLNELKKKVTHTDTEKKLLEELEKKYPDNLEKLIKLIEL